MSSLVLLYASMLGGAQPAYPAPTYHVEVRLVDVSPDGSRQVLKVPAVTLPAGETIRVQCGGDPGAEGEAAEFRLVRDDADACATDPDGIEAQEHTSAWRIRLANTDNGGLTLQLMLRRPEFERLVHRGVITQSRLYNVIQQVQPNRTQRIVLTWDDTGRPVSWLDVRVRDITTAADNTRTVYPFLYEPF